MKLHLFNYNERKAERETRLAFTIVAVLLAGLTIAFVRFNPSNAPPTAAGALVGVWIGFGIILASWIMREKRDD